MIEATAVDPVGRSSVHDLGLWNDLQATAFRRITDFVTAQGSVPGIQLVHAGRKGSTGRPGRNREPTWPTVGPAPCRSGGCPPPPS